MNPLNYATLEASKRLHDAGIVLETYFYWCQDKDGWYFRGEGTYHRDNITPAIPAPSMAEVWRELPEDISYSTMISSLMMWKFNKGKYTEVGYWWHEEIIISKLNTNPTDALIDLLIWVRKVKP